uniref:Cwf21 domain-containing protein n=1 Tax=Rhodnius prolixus TaxID=13249 RepID=T1HTM4_RHOPR
MMEWLTEKTLEQVLKEKRAMEAAAAAGIKAKEAKLNALQKLEQEELKLKQKKDRLMLEAELAEVKARNQVLEEYEAGRKVSKSPIVSGNWGANRQSVNYQATYNGIGLTIPRGSGTYGWVQRNWTLVEKSKDKVNYKTEEDLEKIDSAGSKLPNSEILDHEHKRRIEEKFIELEAVAEHQVYNQDEIETKVSANSTMLMANDSKLVEQPRNECGQIIVRETHQIAPQQEENVRLREAFGITEPLEDARNGNDINVDTEKYPLVYTPSPSPTRNITAEAKKEKKKKTKQNKRDRTQSPGVSSRKKTKDKAKYKKKRKKKEKYKWPPPKFTKKRTPKTPNGSRRRRLSPRKRYSKCKHSGRRKSISVERGSRSANRNRRSRSNNRPSKGKTRKVAEVATKKTRGTVSRKSSNLDRSESRSQEKNRDNGSEEGCARRVVVKYNRSVAQNPVILIWIQIH